MRRRALLAAVALLAGAASWLLRPRPAAPRADDARQALIAELAPAAAPLSPAGAAALLDRERLEALLAGCPSLPAELAPLCRPEVRATARQRLLESLARRLDAPMAVPPDPAGLDRRLLAADLLGAQGWAGCRVAEALRVRALTEVGAFLAVLALARCLPGPDAATVLRAQAREGRPGAALGAAVALERRGEPAGVGGEGAPLPPALQALAARARVAEPEGTATW